MEQEFLIMNNNNNSSDKRESSLLPWVGSQQDEVEYADVELSSSYPEKEFSFFTIITIVTVSTLHNKT